MGLLTGVLGAVGGSLVSGLFNKSSAKDQMEFQAQQTGTEYQRAVEDMKKAGLNPALAYSKGGNSSGTGAKATMDNPSANLAKVAQVEQLKQQTNSAKAQEALTAVQAKRVAELLPYEKAKMLSEANSNPWRAGVQVVDKGIKAFENAPVNSQEIYRLDKYDNNKKPKSKSTPSGWDWLKYKPFKKGN